MKNILLLLILAACAYIAWDFHFGPYDMPLQTTLKNKDGQSLDVIILNKSKNKVDIIARQDNRIYSLPLDGLDLYSRYQVMRSRTGAATGGSGTNAEKSSLGTTASERDAVYVDNLIRQRKSNEAKLTKLEIEMNQALLDHNGKPNSTTRKIQRDVESIQRENLLIDLKVAEISVTQNQ